MATKRKAKKKSPPRRKLLKARIARPPFNAAQLAWLGQRLSPPDVLAAPPPIGHAEDGPSPPENKKVAASASRLETIYGRACSINQRMEDTVKDLVALADRLGAYPSAPGKEASDGEACTSRGGLLGETLDAQDRTHDLLNGVSNLIKALRENL